MKKLILLCAIVTLIVSCNSSDYQSQRCKGLLLDSLTNLSKLRDRVVCLENGACGAMKEYQARIDSLENTIDSLSHIRRVVIVRKPARHTKHIKSVTVVNPHKQVKEQTEQPFYYESTTQKYYFYDSRRKAYYCVDPVTREKRYL